MEGNNEGASVGNVDGDEVGIDCVGLTDGNSVGDGEVGDMLGCDIVGNCEGCAVGVETDGTIVGVLVVG